MIAANRIRWGSIFSNELNMPNLITDCAFESDNSEVASYLNRESVSSESYDGRNKRTIRMKYTESFAPKFTFIKKGFGDFDPTEVRALLKYLTSKETTGLLEVYKDDSNVVEWCAIGNFSEIQLYKIANSRVVGVTATFDSVHPFALSDLYTVTKTISDPSNNKITIDIDTDDNKPVYPRVTIKHNGSVVRIPDGTVYTAVSNMVPNTTYFNGTTYYWKSVGNADDPYYFHESATNPNLTTTSVRFTNKHTDFLNVSKVITPSTIVKNNNTTETVVLDGANRIISSSSVNRVFDTDFNLNWLPLLDGKNEITVEGNCTVTLEWREPRKLGEY